MHQLWAPWRGELISKKEDEPRLAVACVFCSLPRTPAEEGKRAEVDRAALVLGRTQNTFALINRWPYNNGHIMVIPRRHTAKYSDLPDAEWQELSEMLRIAHGIVEESDKPQGMNVGMNLGKSAGAGIEDHMHWHLVPRWNGDTNFMPVLADTKVMIEHLVKTWDRMRPLFDARYHHGTPVEQWDSASEAK